MPYKCPHCGAVSHNENDEKYQYCGRCHLFADGIPWDLERLQVMIEDHEKRRRFEGQMMVALPASLMLMKDKRGPHPLAGQKVTVKSTGQEVLVEDWFERVIDGPPYLLHNMTLPLSIIYFCRMAIDKSVPVDNDVVFVKSITEFGSGSSGLLHNSEFQG